MKAPEGKVVAVRTASATVSVQAAMVCVRCAAGRGCGAGLMQKNRMRLIEASIAEGLRLEVGDIVRLDLPSVHLLKAALLAYGLPLLMMVVAVTAGAALNTAAGDLLLVMVAASGLAAGVLIGRVVLRKNDCLHRMMPTIYERIDENGLNAADASAPGNLSKIRSDAGI